MRTSAPRQKTTSHPVPLPVNGEGGVDANQRGSDLSPLALRETKWYGLVRAAKQRLDPQGEQAITRGRG